MNSQGSVRRPSVFSDVAGVAEAGDLGTGGALMVGTVTAVSERFCVRPMGENDSLSVSMADGCLLRPEAGDVVLLYRPSRCAACWVLSVLVRAQPGHAVLSVGCAETLSIESRELVLKAETSCAVRSPRFDVGAAEVAIRTQALHVEAHSAVGVLGRLSLVARSLHAVVDRLAGRYLTRVTRVERADSLKARHVVLEGEATMSIRGGQLTVDADKTARIDAKQILMG